MSKVERTAPTGSLYEGELINDKMNGDGKFTYCNGTIYQGRFKDNNFEGEGKFIFPQQPTRYSTFIVSFKESCAGVSDGVYRYSDGLTYDTDQWDYCQETDRRFYTERLTGLKPAGKTKPVNLEPAKHIPKGWFDCGDGVYNPKNHVVYKYDTDSFLRNVDYEEHAWIISHCRRGSDFYVGKASKGKDVIPIV